MRPARSVFLIQNDFTDKIVFGILFSQVSLFSFSKQCIIEGPVCKDLKKRGGLKSNVCVPIHSTQT